MSRSRTGLRLAGLLVLLVMAASVAAFSVLVRPLSYEADFDASTRARYPAMAAIMDADPELRRAILHDTEQAYGKGGGPAATARFNALAWEQVVIYAGDAEVLACNAEWTKREQSILRDPEGCSGFVAGQFTSAAGQAVTAQPSPACDAAIRDGARHRHDGLPPRVLSDAEFRQVSEQVKQGPARLTAEEQEAASGRARDDGVLCRAQAKVSANEAALPQGIAARLLRTRFQYGALYPQPTPPHVPHTLAPPELRCPPSGTVFTLSMQARDNGRPVTWVSGGQAGWDCVMISSVSGRRRLWDTLDENPLQLLWPLQVGKTAEMAPGTDGTATSLRVTGHATYWLPFGQVGAYTIDATVSANGRVLYTTTYYWSPELGWKIGQHTSVWSGPWPNTATPDWQVVAMERG